MSDASQDHPILKSSLEVSSLFELFFKRMQPLYSIEYAGLLIYDEQLTIIKESFTATCNLDTEEVATQMSTLPIALSPLQKIVAGFSFPILKTGQEWMDETGMNHSPVNGQAPYQYHCYVPLEVGNRVLGTFELHNTTTELSTECLAFCCSIADLLADIVQHQQNNGTTKTNEPQLEIQHSAGFPDLNGVESLEDFLDVISKLFPSVQSRITKQIDELKTLAAQSQDAATYTHEDLTIQTNYPGIIGAGVGMRRVFGLIEQVANSDSTILILGETGTGKELIAKAIHEHSGQKENAMISVNCAAIPVNLIESELFGHEKGAFTGATDKRIGKFEQADNSTLFLDEIGELPLDLQVKLLRALQEKEIERVGGTSVIKCNVRVIAATNRNLLHEVEQGRFRRDLYFRLNVIPIELPALRERIEDIPLLAAHFINKYAGKSNKHVTGFTKGVIRQLRNYTWPGNVREMEHLIERHVLLSKNAIISTIDLPVVKTMVSGGKSMPKKIKTIDENERDHILEVLQLCNGRVSGAHGAAKLLGVPATTLNSKIKKLGLNKKHF